MLWLGLISGLYLGAGIGVALAIIVIDHIRLERMHLFTIPVLIVLWPAFLMFSQDSRD